MEFKSDVKLGFTWLLDEVHATDHQCCFTKFNTTIHSHEFILKTLHVSYTFPDKHRNSQQKNKNSTHLFKSLNLHKSFPDILLWQFFLSTILCLRGLKQWLLSLATLKNSDWRWHWHTGWIKHCIMLETWQINVKEDEKIYDLFRDRVHVCNKRPKTGNQLTWQRPLNLLCVYLWYMNVIIPVCSIYINIQYKYVHNILGTNVFHPEIRVANAGNKFLRSTTPSIFHIFWSRFSKRHQEVHSKLLRHNLIWFRWNLVIFLSIISDAVYSILFIMYARTGSKSPWRWQTGITGR